MKKRRLMNYGFTLVELLIVIALIAILSVAVLATINPIEQANKARDSRVQNDAAEVMNAYERYYASLQRYPWEEFWDGGTESAMSSADLVGLRSDMVGFGVCSGAGNAAALRDLGASDQATDCDSSDDVPNYLIDSSELKSSFVGKDEFEPVRNGTHEEQGLWTLKAQNSNSVYVCYIPKADANRKDTAKMRCINTTTGVVTRVGEGGCLETVTAWDTPSVAGTEAMFRCVPE